MPPPVVAITGGNGTLGRELLLGWHRRGAHLIALTTCEDDLALQDRDGVAVPLRQICWRAGAEDLLDEVLEEVDVLVINHGLNVHGARDAMAVDQSLQVNALSGWRLLELFASVVARRCAAGCDDGQRPPAEVWVNTSEAEVQPALSPLYEISKRLLGELLSLRALDLSRVLRIRRLVLGPFRSPLNPIGLMDAGWVAGQILNQAGWGWDLIIVTINPLTYITMPLAALARRAYFSLCSQPAQEPLRRNGP